MTSTEFSLNSRISRRPGHLSSKVDNEIVILNIDKGEYNGLDEIGSEIWYLLETPMTVNEIVSKLLETYDIDEQQCILDVTDFIIDLDKAGLIHLESEV